MIPIPMAIHAFMAQCVQTIKCPQTYDPDMDEDVNQISFTATGEGAVSSITSILEGFAQDGEFDKVYVELGKTSSDEQIQDSQASLPFHENGVESGETKADISSGTSYHKVLSALSQLEDELPVPTKRVLEVIDMPEGTAYAAMSSLHEKGLVNRTDGKNENNSYEYEISESGKRELDRLGEIN